VSKPDVREVREVRSTYTGQETWKRHRRYGWDAPACDIDCIEYDYGAPVAMIEDKHSNASPDEGTRTNHPTQNAKRALADAAGVPFFSRRYWTESWMQLVIPLNEEADVLLHTAGELLTEFEYVDMLYRLRDSEMPGGLDLSGRVDPAAQDWCLKYHPNALIVDEDFA